MIDHLFPSLSRSTIQYLNTLSESEYKRIFMWFRSPKDATHVFVGYRKIPLRNLPLSPRAYKCLKANYLTTIFDVLFYGVENICLVRNMDARSAYEITILFEKIAQKKNKLVGLSKEEIAQTLNS
jgi:hypothetical protein